MTMKYNDKIRKYGFPSTKAYRDYLAQQGKCEKFILSDII